MILDLLLGGLGKTALVTLRQQDQDITICTMADIKRTEYDPIINAFEKMLKGLEKNFCILCIFKRLLKAINIME